MARNQYTTGFATILGPGNHKTASRTTNNLSASSTLIVSSILNASVVQCRLYNNLTRENKKKLYEKIALGLQKNYDCIVYTDGSCRRGVAGYGAWWGYDQGHSGPYLMNNHHSVRNSMQVIHFNNLFIDTLD